MTDVRTFQADTMQQALEMVRHELGSEAVILHTRQVAGRRFLPWKKVKESVEITAGVGVNVQRPETRSQDGTATERQIARKKRRAARLRGAEQPTSTATSPTLGELMRQPADSAKLPPAIAALRDVASDIDTVSISSASSPPASMRPGLGASALDVSPNPHATTFDPTAEFATKLDAIQKMLENLKRSGRTDASREVPGELFHLYTELIDAEVEDDLARDLMIRLKANSTPEQLADVNVARGVLTSLVESEIRCSEPISAVRGRRKVVALVGATGVGKTTTIAKLAANFRLRDGVKMGLVTVDTYRIAAVEQLRTYAEIIDLPMKVVTSPNEMRRALEEFIGLDLILIDTAGRSPRDDLQIQELKRLLAEADVDEVHLVLSMSSSLRTLEATAEKFSAANATSIIMTKLDEAAGMGPLLSLSRKVGLPISYLTTGQDVPDDIEAATSTRMARLVLGSERVTT